MNASILFRGLHAEIQDSYLLYTRVLTNPPLFGVVKIDIIDENDQIPTFDIRSITLSVLENEQGNRTIGKIQAYDLDILPENNAIRYYSSGHLNSAEVTALFRVEPDGTIWTNAVFGPNNNNQSSYRLFVTAANPKLLWNTPNNASEDFQIDIQVISANQHRPGK